jgi:hypothetical protein
VLIGGADQSENVVWQGPQTFCKGETGGHSCGVLLDHGLKVPLTFVTAETVNARKSAAECVKVRVDRKQTALLLQNSLIRMTDVYLRAPCAQPV